MSKLKTVGLLAGGYGVLYSIVFTIIVGVLFAPFFTPAYFLAFLVPLLLHTLWITAIVEAIVFLVMYFTRKPKRNDQMANGFSLQRVLSILNIVAIIILPIAIAIELGFLIWLFAVSFLLFPIVIAVIIGVIPNIYNIVIIIGSIVVLVLYLVRVFPRIRRGEFTRSLAIEVSVYAALLIIPFYLSFESGAVFGVIAGILWYIIMNR